MNPNTLRAVAVAVALSAPAVAGASIQTPPADTARPVPSNPGGSSRRFTFTYEASWDQLDKSLSNMDFWVPMPWSNAYQSVSDLLVSSGGQGDIIVDPVYGNEIFHSHSARRGGLPYNLRMRCIVERKAVRYADLSHRPLRPALEPAGLGRYLEGDRLAPIDDAIRSRASSITGKLIADEEKARAIYDHITEKMKLVVGRDEWGQGDIQRLAKTMEGSSFDVSALFVGLVRASGIPARVAVGFLLPAGETQGYLSRPHAWAEFWLAGFGWVPADPALAIERPAERDLWFGRLDANRIQISVGRDIALSPSHAGDPLDFLLYPYAQADGLYLGGSSYRFSFEPAPPPAPPPAAPPSP